MISGICAVIWWQLESALNPWLTNSSNMQEHNINPNMCRLTLLSEWYVRTEVHPAITQTHKQGFHGKDQSLCLELSRIFLKYICWQTRLHIQLCNWFFLKIAHTVSLRPAFKYINHHCFVWLAHQWILCLLFHIYSGIRSFSEWFWNEWDLFRICSKIQRFAEWIWN